MQKEMQKQSKQHKQTGQTLKIF